MVYNIMVRKINFGGINITIEPLDNIINYIKLQLLSEKSSSIVISFINAYVFCLAYNNNKLKQIINDSEIITIDGISISYAFMITQFVTVKRVIMTHLFDKFLMDEGIPNYKAILIGLTEKEAQLSSNAINKISKNINIIHAISGFHSEKYYKILFSRYRDIKFIIIGMSSPKSEYICKIAKDICTSSVIWHVGAGTLKCYAGTKKRCPKWISSLGFEWVHRFLFEKHTRKRYLIHNFQFIFIVIKIIIKNIFNHQKSSSKTNLTH